MDQGVAVTITVIVANVTILLGFFSQRAYKRYENTPKWRDQLRDFYIAVSVVAGFFACLGFVIAAGVADYIDQVHKFYLAIGDVLQSIKAASLFLWWQFIAFLTNTITLAAICLGTTFSTLYLVTGRRVRLREVKALSLRSSKRVTAKFNQPKQLVSISDDVVLAPANVHENHRDFMVREWYAMDEPEAREVVKGTLDDLSDVGYRVREPHVVENIVRDQLG